ncbi:M56 family metallopeptidase [Evtepia sp.]|uniref:M56 family metallopeptidase n=1 Tax=Evtepia sp. TaxID=2773933 RepID=UPI003F16B7CA
MLDSLFYSLLDMSLSASVVILVVLAARLALKRVPALFSYLLWAVVFFRLLCPAAIPLPAALSGAGGPILPTGELLAGPQAPAEAPPLAPMESAVDLLPWLWLLGVLLLSLRSLLSLARLRRRLAGAVPLARGLYLTDAIPTPFVLGLIHPRIYLPSGLPEESRDHIIRHEQTHIRRGDPLWKALAFAALTLHWFNPLVWLAFFLAERDMELSCDERAVKGLDQNARADYAALLLDLSAGKGSAGLSLAFGEGNTSVRIKNLLKNKKPSRWAAAVAAVFVLALTMILITKPADQAPPETGTTAILTKDAVLTDCASYTNTADGGMTWLPAEDTTLPKGTLVAVLEEEAGTPWVQVINGDASALYGYLPGDALSRDPEALTQGSWAMIERADAYDGPNGNVVGTLEHTRVSVEAWEGPWCQVAEAGGGNRVWVRTEALSFQFHEP